MTIAYLASSHEPHEFLVSLITAKVRTLIAGLKSNRTQENNAFECMELFTWRVSNGKHAAKQTILANALEQLSLISYLFIHIGDDHIRFLKYNATFA